MKTAFNCPEDRAEIAALRYRVQKLEKMEAAEGHPEMRRFRNPGVRRASAKQRKVRAWFKKFIKRVPTRTRKLWARKAAATRCERKLAACRADYSGAVEGLSESGETPMSVEKWAGMVGHNPELLVVHNPGRRRRSPGYRYSFNVKHRRNAMRRRRGRNSWWGESRRHSVARKLGWRRQRRSGRKGSRRRAHRARRGSSWKALVKRHGVMGAKKLYRKGGKRRARRGGRKYSRRSRARSAIAKKVWRTRRWRTKHCVRRRRRAANSRRNRSWKSLVKQYGVKGAKKHYHRK